jgi:hypothetical protein
MRVRQPELAAIPPSWAASVVLPAPPLPLAMAIRFSSMVVHLIRVVELVQRGSR